MVSPLNIPPNKRWKGLTVYCYKCNTNVYDICKETGKPIQQCPFGEKHAFKVYVHVPGTENERRTKKLNTRNVNEAIKQAIDFENQVKENDAQTIEIVTANNKRGKEIQYDSPLLIYEFAEYISFLHNEGVPEHKIEIRSREHIRDVERALNLFMLCLKNNGYDYKSLRVDQVDDKIVGHIYSYLKHEMKYSERSVNKHLSYFTTFFKYEIEVKNFKGPNWFQSVNREPINPKPESISKEEFEMLLKQITPENTTRIKPVGKKSKKFPYYSWLPDAYLLSLLTGRRGEEVCKMKFDGYHDDGNGNAYISVEDFKVNRIRRRSENNKKLIFIPVTKSLHSLLLKLGLEEHKGDDVFILAPEVKIDRHRIMPNIMSRGFTGYYDQLNTGKKLTYKSLRKTYISQLSVYLGGNAKAVTQHSSNAVIDKYYLDKKVVTQAAQGFEVFPDKSERQNELEGIRSESNRKRQQPILEK